MVRIRLVGALSVEIDGQPVDVPPGRAAELLAWLAAHPGRHPRARLAALFWPDVPDSTARASLRTAVWALRKALGPDGEAALVLDRNTIALEGPALWVDLRERESWSAEEVLTADVDNLIDGVEGEWADGFRAAHRAAVARLLSGLDEEAEAAGDAVTAARVARRLCEIGPFSEENHRLLLRRLLGAGDRAAAMREHEAFRRRLWDELGVRPSRATLDLAHRISSSANAETGRLPARLARLEQEPLVGREEEQRRLLDVWKASCLSPGVQVVLLEGEAGIGKTRLLAAFAHEIHATRAHVLFGAASEDQLLPGEPFREAVGEGEGLEGDRLIEATRASVEAATARSPVALLLDDFHWADTASFAILRRLARLPVETGLTMVVAYRSEGDAAARFSSLAADVGRDAPVVRLAVPPLSLADTSALIADLDPDGLLRERAERIHLDAHGNPFFVRELGRYYLEHSDRLDAAATVPDPVRDLVVAKLQILGPLAREIVPMAAVLGARAEAAVLSHMQSNDDVLDALEEAGSAGLMEEEDVGVHTFRHALVRTAVYGSLSKGRRAELHRRAADALRAVHGEREGLHLCDIAEHRCAGSPPDSPSAAAADALRGGRWAVDHGAYDRAVVVLTKALQVCEPSGRQELAVLRAIAYQRLTHAFIDPVTA